MDEKSVDPDQKPADQDLHCFQKRVEHILTKSYSHSELIWSNTICMAR